MLRKTNISLRTVNNLLLAGIIIVNLYTILAPLSPSVVFWWQGHATPKRQELSRQLSSDTAPAPLPTQNTLVAPSMILDTPIHEGTIGNMYKTLDQGVWRWPAGSTPDKGGNTILIGHRFTYTNPNGIFYHLDKVKVNDSVGIFWGGTKYVYKVTTVSVVQPTQIEILDQTADARLTLYTCTPTWNPKKRLVVVATLQSTRSYKAT